MSNTARGPSPGAAVWRGLRGCCPRCGAHTLFRAYLKLAPTCSACGADFTGAETADIAPYATVFVIGIFATPALLIIAGRTHAPDAILLPAAAVSVVVAALVILPRAKGALAALFWQMRNSGAT